MPKERERPRVRINGSTKPSRDDSDRPLLRTNVNSDDLSDHLEGESGDLGLTATARILLHQNKNGRPKGSQNRVTVVLKQAIMAAAQDVGEDGLGKDGVVGYMRRLALHEPATFGSLLRRIMPVQVKADVNTSAIVLEVMKVVAHGDQRANGHLAADPMLTRRLNHLAGDDA